MPLINITVLGPVEKVTVSPRFLLFEKQYFAETHFKRITSQSSPPVVFPREESTSLAAAALRLRVIAELVKVLC